MSREMLFWHWKSYFDIRTELENAILTFELIRKIVFWHSKSNFDIRTESENTIMIFKILFWHWNWVGKSYFDIQILFWHSNWVGKSYFDIRNPNWTFELRRKIVFLHTKILFWHSSWVGKCYFDIRNPFVTFELSRKIVFWHSLSYFDIRTESEILFSLWCDILFSRCPSAYPSLRMSICPWNFFFHYLENAVMDIHQFLQTHWYQ